jgi:hypothetical protein
VSPDHGTDILWVIWQDIPECQTPEPGEKLNKLEIKRNSTCNEKTHYIKS